jgi:dimethylglycine dehydrogenase
MLGETCIGLTTSGGYGHRTGKSLFFACVPHAQASAGSEFEIILQGQRRQARVLGEPAYDPTSAKMRV